MIDHHSLNISPHSLIDLLYSFLYVRDLKSDLNVLDEQYWQIISNGTYLFVLSPGMEIGPGFMMEIIIFRCKFSSL